MKIGYPCINLSMDCRSSRTFRLTSYSEKRFKETVKNNLNCLFQILRFNLKHNLFFFRITSGLIPFAPHPICQINWQKIFKKDFKEIGDFIKQNKIRVSMHPGHFVVVNSLNKSIFKKSVKEIVYHVQVLDLMELDQKNKVQVHLGGVYQDKEKSLQRFIENYKKMPSIIKKRLVIENDEHSYGLKDCLKINQETDLPVVFDVFHHQLNNNGENLKQAFKLFLPTWQKKDGLPMVDYSSQQKSKRPGSHAQTINLKDFRNFLKQVKNFDFDLVLEIKDKEKSALRVVSLIDKIK